MKNFRELSKQSFEAEVVRAGVPVVVDLYASWCGPCKVLGLMLSQFAENFEGRIQFVKVKASSFN